MKKLVTVISCLLATYAVQAEQVNLNKMNKQLNIMENIIKSSVSGEITADDERRVGRISSIESTYLQGQGVLFTVRSSIKRGHWGEHFPVAPIPPMPPVLSEHELSQIEIATSITGDEIEETIAQAMESANETYEESYAEHYSERYAHSSLSDERELYRDLRDEQRDLAYELRDLERESRDLNYKLKRAEKSQRKALEKQVEKLTKEKKALKANQEELMKRSTAFQQKQSAQKEKQEQHRKAYYSELSHSVAETLCLYGNALKQLPKNEHVSFILKSSGDKVHRHYKDTVYVFTKQNINKCAVDNIDTKGLLKTSNTYQF